MIQFLKIKLTIFFAGERVEGRTSLTYQSQQKRKVVKMVVVVLLVFVICCSPLQLLMGSAIFNTDTEVSRVAVLLVICCSPFQLLMGSAIFNINAEVNRAAFCSSSAAHPSWSWGLPSLKLKRGEQSNLLVPSHRLLLIPTAHVVRTDTG
jgi:hypothetical protein